MRPYEAGLGVLVVVWFVQVVFQCSYENPLEKKRVCATLFQASGCYYPFKRIYTAVATFPKAYSVKSVWSHRGQLCSTGLVHYRRYKRLFVGPWKMECKFNGYMDGCALRKWSGTTINQCGTNIIVTTKSRNF